MLIYLSLFCVVTTTVQAECGPGFTGPWCETKCSDGCADGKCTLHNHGGIVCSQGCKQGWAGESCRTPCAEHCKRCNRTRSKDCEECQHSYYGDTCDRKCETCGPMGCNKDGMCKERPVNCDGGVICGGTCIKKCRFCNTDGTCSKCQSNYAGGTCETPCPNCRGICTQAGCLDGCRCGYYGPFCQKPCSSKCSESCDNIRSSSNDICDKHNGTCLKGCKDGHFGERCQHRCNTNCKACKQIGGQCIQGCHDGYYGESCENACVNCKHDRCARNGLCPLCKNGYYGPACNSKCESICTFACERYSGVCQGTATKVHESVAVPLSPSGNTAISDSENMAAETKSKEEEGLPSFVIWLCVALGVLAVISLASVGFCHYRYKTRRYRRKKDTALLTRSISQGTDPASEVPSAVTPNNDYDEIPEISDAITGMTQVNIDEGQSVLKVGVAHFAEDTAVLGGVCMGDNMGKGKVVKYLSVSDTVIPGVYLDIIG
ncbi:protein draper-like [Haliotis cracherodii]|uniref:protein draper-like n=1 Tax=Haliotis cracherodii TaxID=6455 RepID=UPI0039EA01EF